MNYSDFKKEIIRKGTAKYIPVCGELELCTGCNFCCKMCYVRGNEFFDKKELFKVLKEAKTEGLLFLIITGGEPLLHPDFIDIYNYICDLGISVSIFTNAYLINDEILELFKRRKPESIHITIYGANNESYSDITKSNDGFSVVSNNLKKLQESNINLFLRTIIIKDVYNDLDNVINFMKSFNTEIEASLFLFANKENSLENRLSADEVYDFYQRMRTAFNNGDKKIKFSACKHNGIYGCTSGRSSFYMNCHGELVVCSSFKKIKVKEKTFEDSWKILVKRRKENELDNDCTNCVYNKYCLACFGKLEEKDNRYVCNAYLRSIAIKFFKDSESGIKE